MPRHNSRLNQVDEEEALEDENFSVHPTMYEDDDLNKSTLAKKLYFSPYQKDPTQ